MTAIYATDPATGESVTLSELSTRYSLSVSTLSRRHARGKRGEALVAGADAAARLAELKANARAAAERKHAIMSASGKGLNRPLKTLGEACSKAGGNHHV